MAKHWVIPDIHGCFKTLQALFVDHIKPTPEDQIFFLGDYIDRGPDSKSVINFIMNLQKELPNVIALKGNHEDYLLKAYTYDLERKTVFGLKTKSYMQKEWEKQGGATTLRSFGVKWPAVLPPDYIEWLKNLPHYHELDSCILVHAGLNFENENPFEDTQAMMWARDYEIVPEKIHHKTIIHGHVPVKLEFIDRIIKSGDWHFIDLDNGVYMTSREGYGNLVALELSEMKYVIQPTLDEINY
ncbi:MAG: serine/threonine protein phosphatase [Bacteroidetes bacterium]|nr:serine/threonine protein phosphatase [Bacteroidota bacterium]